MNLISEVQRAGETVKENPEGPLYQVDENSTSNVSNPHKIDPTKPHSFQVDTDKLDELKEQLGAQTQEIRDELSAEIAKLEALIEKYSLNNYLQDKIDEEIERRIEKAKKESKDVQKDIDRASTLLSGLGNEYNDFVSGISNELIAKFNSKIDPKLVEAQAKLKKANANLATAATALNGAKFIAGGMPAGLVVTKAKKKKKKGDKDGNGISTDLTGGLASPGGSTSAPPTPPKNHQILVNFRPHSGWRGEFGFDWFRVGDTALFGDNKYEDIVSKQYKDAAHTILETDGNEYKGNFKKDPTKLALLKKLYNPFSPSWATTDASGNKVPEDQYVPWLSIYKSKLAKLTLLVDVQEPADYLEFETNPNFTITPNKISSPKGTNTSSVYADQLNITILCSNEFKKDQTIILNAFKKDPSGVLEKIEVGKINVWANHSSKQKKIKVLFVEVKTPELKAMGGENTGSSTADKIRMTRYLNQAMINLDSNSTKITLDMSNDPDFSQFEFFGQLKTESTIQPKYYIHQLLEDRIKSKYRNLYKNHFKAYYFAEPAGGTAGYSIFNSNFVVVYAGASHQTGAHEFFHSFGIEHSFSNGADFTYQYAKTSNLLDYSHRLPGRYNDRYSLRYWQWVKANANV